MPENDTTRNDYAKYRIDRAKENPETAHLLFEAGKYRIANNRAYYAIFHALIAVLVFDDFDSSKHSGVIAEFRRRYIKEGIFPTEISKMIGQAFTIRNASDYDDMFLASKSDTEEQISNADYVYELISQYIMDKIENKENQP